ncbi:septin [Lophiostoma macrostomum CBS 122681]|uniref:Septin n=1 Tax=Lophiostoma macrostomum CBS 122681 TaxID=1314788 RepID=A0A6A6T1L6_9PLEO|nr:septin [Lophiostoma macrostomum CBS 122681]
MSKKQKALAQEEALRKQREAAMLPKQPPRLPSHSPFPQIATFGGEEPRPDSVAIVSGKASGYGHNFSRPSVEYNMAPRSNVPAPPVPGSSPSYMDYDPYPRTESMTNRGRYSYASSAISSVNSPRRVRRRKDPTPFNILVIGSKGSGKSSFIDFLRTALALPAKKRGQTQAPPPALSTADSPFTCDFLETEVDGERVGVTLWDSQGLEKSIVDFQLPVITSFLESKFEETFTEEQKVVRAPGVRDTHIHCVFLILDPARLDANVAEARKKQNKMMTSQIIAGLDEDLDLNVIREMQGKTTVIPVISKADTITAAHMRHLKKMVWDTLKRAKLDPLEALHLSEEDSEDEDRLDERDEDEYIQSSDNEGKSDLLNKLVDRSSSEPGSDTSSRSSAQSPPTSPPSAKRNHNRKPSAMSASIHNDDSELPYLPLSIISPDIYEPEIIGRQFPWGFADPYNAEHCDFIRLRESVFSEWRAELREASREQWYEGWRTNRLQRGPAKRRVATSDGLSRQQLSVPSHNGRAMSAGSREPRQRSPGY